MTDQKPFEAGDMIVVRKGYDEETDTIVCIDHITPTGIFVLENGKRFRPDGTSYEKIDRWGEREHLHAVTEDILRGIQKRKIVSRLERYTKWDDCSLETLKHIAELLWKKNSDE